jgi:hypothetical protein
MTSFSKSAISFSSFKADREEIKKIEMKEA